MAACQTKSNDTVLMSFSDPLLEAKSSVIAFQKIHQIQLLVKSGDLILRTGRDYTSELMRQLSKRDRTYSHGGIASWENDTLFVYHSLGGEWNPDQKIRKDPFSFFCNPYENRGFGVFRYSTNKARKEKIIHQTQHFFAEEVMFDMDFNLLTDDRMYCSEFVSKIIERGTDSSIQIKSTTINNIRFIAIDNLFLNEFCKEISRVKF